jgi:TrmH family RNA methyltransferase
VRALRALLRDRDARRDSRRFVVEGPRLIDAALAHDAPIDTVFVAADAPGTAVALGERAVERGAALERLAPGVCERIADTVTSQGVLAVVQQPSPDLARDALATADFVVIAEQVNDPGNAGAVWRSAAAAGASGIVLGAGSVDAYNPKLVRATAGACFSIPVADGADVAGTLRALGDRGVQRVGATAHGGALLTTVDWTVPCAVVVGHETRGLDTALPLDALVTIPMASASESLNLAMAATVACFEVARQRAAAGGAS